MKNNFILCNPVNLKFIERKFWLFVFLFSSLFLFSQSYTTPGTYTWTAPCGVTSITVEAWGGGGSGGGTPAALNGTRRGGGGGGGAYARSIVTVTPGTTYSITVGSGGTSAGGNGNKGGSSIFGTSVVVATGGFGGDRGTSGTSSGGAGATAASCIGTTTYSGGNSIASTGRSGSGGGGAGNTGNGSNSTAGNFGAGGPGSLPGGNGARGVQGNNDGEVGSQPGGGGSGANSTGFLSSGNFGAAGGAGKIVISYTSSFPTYCPKPISNTEPITNVTFAGINKTTSNSTGSPANEYFCDIANVTQGLSYPISLKGNTVGNYTNYFTVFVDWDQNGVYGNNANEKYEVGSISNSTGIDAKTVTGSIAVPSGALIGSTRMRVVKNFGGASDACDAITWGQTEDYTVVIATPLPCTGTPAAGTMSLSPTTGAANSTFTGTVTGDTSASGLTYQWQIGDSATGPWVDIPGATNATQTLTAVSSPNTTKYYRRKIICLGSGTEAISNVVSFKTNTVTYCEGRTLQRQSHLFINDVSFVGTLADQTNLGSSYSSTGFQDWTTSNPTVQADGEVINVTANVGGTVMGRGTWKAWVDWNGNGIFDNPGELVYSNRGYITPNVSFGFVVPSGTASGNYRMRIRVNGNLVGGADNFLGPDFGPCDDFSSTNNTNGGFGETEDYSIKVIYNCPAKISAINVNPGDGERCGTGKVQLSVTGNGASYKWYTAESGGTAISGATGNTYETTSINSSRYYYVTAISSGGCETVYRTPVFARINPAPVVNFSVSNQSICGDEAAAITLTSSGDKREATMLEEKFSLDTPDNLGLFENTTAGLYTNSNGFWLNQASPFIPPNPPHGILRPAISSGYSGGKFAAIVTDINRTVPILNHMTLRNNYDTTGFINLKLDFDLFYYSNTTDPGSAFFKVDYTINGGGSWTNLRTVTTNTGNPNIWVPQSITIPNSALNSTQFKVRFSVFADADAVAGWNANIATIDNVRIYGDKPLTTAFGWSGATSVLFEGDCVTPLTSTSNSICIKPSAAQIESDASWTVTATASFDTGCDATRTITIQNDTKTWNPTTASNWTDARWLPTTSVPDLDKCVVIKKPVSIGTSTDGLAKNIKIDTSGKLTVAGSLTVNDKINNTTGDARNLIVKSDGNLKQIDDTVINTTPVAVRRIHNLTGLRKQYNYISSPVKDQNMKLIFGDVTNNVPFVTVLNEGTNFFVNAKTADYGIAARGFSVREPKTAYEGVDLGGGTNNIASNEAEYKGVPNNGTIPNLDLAFSNSDGNHGYNVVGNPYPSNLDIIDLYNNSVNNLDIRPEFKFWDNSINDIYTQMGNGYQGYSYAVFNVANGPNGLGTAAPGRALPGDPAGLKVPTRVVKVTQAFMVQALKAGASLKFKNTMRKTTATPFFGKDSPDNYYRLEFITPDSLVIQNAVSYFAGGNAGIGIEDSKIPNASASDAIFNLVDNEKLIINGNPLFTSDHVINLGTRNSKAGTYQIRAIDQSGLFANGQVIYLKDKQLGILTDISTEPYIFTSESGEFTNRFEIVYKPGGVLASDNITKANIQLYRDQLDFVLQSSGKKIVHFELYDMSGRLMLSKKANSKEVRFNAETLVEGAYVLRAKMEDGETFTKKLRK